ncbi:hypothetical protein F5Y03DRAFT_389974 [Xylaria venustula]|nr:hypothetical protein F5Y03DRAFT_389974 [Xylaria venustula]
MSSTKFQEYLEGMNRQPLDRKSEHQSSRVLLPHQRTGPAQEPESPTPNISEKQAEHGACQQDGAKTSPGCSARDKTPARNMYSSPEPSTQLDVQTPPSNCQNNGLAKSRWANSSYNGTPVRQSGQPLNNFSASAQRQPTTTMRRPNVTPLSKSNGVFSDGTPDEKNTPLTGNAIVIPRLSPSALSGQNNRTYPLEKGEPDHKLSNGWEESDSIQHKVEKPVPQFSTAAASVRGAEGSSQPIKKHSSPSINAVPDPRVNWPTESGVPGGIGQDIARQNRTSRANPAPLSSKKSTDEMSTSTEGERAVPPHVTDFIEHWRQTAHSVEADFLSQNRDPHGDCDVNTYSGDILEPIDYPATKQQELMSRAQLEQTSAVFMRQLIAGLARRDPKRKAQKKAEKEARAAARAAAAAVAAAGTPEVSTAELPNINEVQIPCHLRPAVESDIEAIAAIYNQEVADGYKLMDTKPVRQEDFRTIYSQSLVEKMPFVVAVAGWHGAMNTSHQEVIGFALITAVSRGIAGSYDTSSRRGGKLLVIVKPQCRRKKIGTALMDIIITNCTGWHMSKGGYQFVNFTHDWMSNEYGSSPRTWWYLEMDIMIRSAENEERAREGEEFQWIWNFLESKFTLLLQHYDEKCFYHPHKMYWLDKLTFRRDCRTRGA